MEHVIKKTDTLFYIGESPSDHYAELDYYINRNGIIIATHTEVSDNYRGQGLALLLFEALIALAREKNTTIIPYCSYVAGMLKKTEYNIYLHK